MLFARFFGKRREEDEEPEAQPAPVLRPRTPLPTGSGDTAAATGQFALRGGAANQGAPPARSRGEMPAAAVKEGSQGFDPYNTGVFKKANAWERINRR